jgi:hypothetical protein
MTALTDDLVQRVREHASAGGLTAWPGVLLSDDLAAVRERLDAALAWLPPPARVGIFDALNESSDGLQGLAILWSAALAGVAGWTVDEVVDGALIVQSGSARAALLPLAVPARPLHSRLLTALEARLDPVFDGRPWALVLRRPLPDDVDLDRIIEPVRMWLVAVERGRWDGDYAIYEDGGVSLELRLLETEASGAGPRLRVPGLMADRTAEDIAVRFEAMLSTSTLPSDLPRIPVLVRSERWPLTERRRQELLYGKILEFQVDAEGAATISFRQAREAPSGRDIGLFGRPEAAQVAAVWWLCPDPADPLVPCGRADENPWGDHAAAGPRFPGLRMAVSFVGQDEGADTPASLTRERAMRGIRIAP